MKRTWTLLLCGLLLLGGCTKPVLLPDTTDPGEVTPGTGEDTDRLNTYRYAGYFARNMMNLYYLWQQEISADLEKWDDSRNPIDIVDEIRYHTGSGADKKYIDRWSLMTEDYTSLYSSVAGNNKTSGLDVTYYALDSGYNSFYAVVNFVYKDSPADKAGLKRGDVITTVNGEAIGATNLNELHYTLMGGDTIKLTLLDGKTLNIASKEMYEDPLLLSKVFDCGGKKVGYLHFTSFTLDACEPLVKVFSGFKEQGVSELILDLRYNSGGFVWTERALASMLAPEAEVLAGSVMSTEVYNSALTEAFRQEGTDTNTYFQTQFEFTSDGKKYNFSTAGANPGLKKIYVIISRQTASASEAIVCDLHPYMDLTMIGKQSSGKYCSGLLMSSELFLEMFASQINASISENIKKYAPGWGLYLMYSRYADKNGETLCMPDGLTPDYELDDNPLDGYDLGDPGETLLAKALSLCGYQAVKARSLPARSSGWSPEPGLAPLRPGSAQPLEGGRILLPQQIILPR